MDSDAPQSRESEPRGRSLWRLLAGGLVRLCRLPFDLLFLTVDYLRLTLWMGMEWRAPLLAARLTGFGPPAALDTIEVSGRRMRRCGLARKYGNPALLRLLLPDLLPVRVQHGKVIWAWEQGSILHPTTPTRYITLGLALALGWGGPALVLAVPVSRHAIRQRLPWLRPAPSATLTQHARSREAVAGLCANADRLLAAASYPEARAAYRQALAVDPGNPTALLGSGMAALELGLNSEAEESLNKVLRDAPGNHRAAWGLARLAFQASAYKKAIEALKKVLAAQPDDVPALALLADSHRCLGELDQALAVALDALKRSPADGKLMLTAAGIQVDKENLDEAESLFRKALEAGEKGADGRLGLARLLRTRGRTSECETALRSILQDFPDHPDTAVMLVDLWSTQGATARATEFCREVTQRRPTIYALRERLGGLLIRSGDFDGAFETASALLRDQPGSAMAHVQLASIFLQKGLPSQAIEQCLTILQQGSNPAEAHRLLAAAYMMKRDPVQAMASLETILKALPNDLESLMRLAECQAHTGAAEKAIETLTGAAQRHPLSFVPLAELGRHHFGANRPAEALAAFRKAYEVAPGEWSAQNNLAAMLALQSQELDLALDLARKAYSTAPANPSVADTLGWILVLRGAYAEAEPFLDFAEATLSDSVSPLYHHAELKARTGDRDSALRLARRAIEVGANAPDAARARQLLETLTREKQR